MRILDGARRFEPEEVERQIRQWVGRLAALGVNPGSRVAALAMNSAEVAFAALATLRLGGTWVALNARLTAAELRPQLEKVRPALVLADEERVDRAPGAMKFDSFDPKAPRSDVAAQLHPLSANSPQLILFTSGTTGSAKAACLTAQQLLKGAAASAQRLGTDAQDRWLCSLPLFHVGGLAMLFRAAHDGSTLVIERKFDAARTWSALEAGEISCLSLVATTLRALLEARPRTHRRLAQLKAVLVGGGPTPPQLLRAAREAGLPVLQTYGLTEAGSQFCTESPDGADGMTAGTPLFGNEIRILDEARTPLAVGQIGDVWIRGPTVMLGYLDDPQANARSFLGRWFRTGDLGSVDARGRLSLASRRTDLIVSGGENVYPAELEAVLSTHASVVEAAVVAEDDPRWGQVPVAALVGKLGALSALELEQWCRSRLAGFKIPKRFVFLEQLPRTASGKVDRRALRELLVPATPSP